MAFGKNILKNKPEKITPDSAEQEIKVETSQPDFGKETPSQEVEPVVESESETRGEQVPAQESDLPSLAPAPADVPITPSSAPKSVACQKIESILEEDLEEIYFRLDSAHQRLFREEGERTARQIEGILATGKSVAVKILAVIRKWLQFIPGLNKFFIEQEAKIKTDKITKINSPLPPQ